jgi:CubicO group peptidase (beta-lactamase class C family)
MRHRCTIALLLLLGILFQCSAQQPSNLLEEIRQNHPYMRTIVIRRNERAVLTYYRANETEATLLRINSVSKSITSALVGIAIDKGLIKDVDEKVITFFPEVKSGVVDSRCNDITIKHLLTMTSGIQYNLFRDINMHINQEKLAEHCLNKQLISKPGETYNYNDPGVQLLNHILERTTKSTIEKFAQDNLFGPLGVSRHEWHDIDRSGVPFGSHGLRLTCEDMTKFGSLYLNKGLWNGRQVIPAAWVNSSWSKHSHGYVPFDADYGYLWWLSKVGNEEGKFALGFGGQFILVFPDLSAVVAITCDSDQPRDPRVMKLIEDFVVPFIKSKK